VLATVQPRDPGPARWRTPCSRAACPACMPTGLSRLHVTGWRSWAARCAIPSPCAGRCWPPDWKGLSIGVPLRRPGADNPGPGRHPGGGLRPAPTHDLATGAMQGFEPDMQRYAHSVPTGGGRYVTANGALWPLIDVLFANGPARLPHRPAARLAAAGRPAGRRQIGEPSAGQNGAYIRQACAMGARFATAIPGGPGRPPPGVHRRLPQPGSRPADQGVHPPDPATEDDKPARPRAGHPAGYAARHGHPPSAVPVRPRSG
jgi:hypothetical protein